MAAGPGKSVSFALEFADLGSETERPELVAHVVDRSGKAVGQTAVGKDGRFVLSSASLAHAAEVAIGPRGAYPLTEPGQFVRLPAGSVQDAVKADGTIALSRLDWSRFFLVTVCVDGSVTACRWWPPIYQRETAGLQALIAQGNAVGPETELSRAVDAKMALLPWPPLPWPSCSAVCSGFVDIYRRTCCCPPIYVRDPRIDEIIRRLRELRKQQPPIHWPPPPPPQDPFGPVLAEYEQAIIGGVPNEAMLRSDVDLATIVSLGDAVVPEYINARDYLRYLWCSCGSATKVASGAVRPDGTFSVCWREPVSVELPGCSEEYAFVVRQLIGGVTTTIYDGVAAGRWFNQRSGINLTTYDPQAIRCGSGGGPDDGSAYAYLELIGGTPSYNLKTPGQTGWDRVSSPGYNDGLAFPAANAAAAKGQWLDRNWGGTLNLYYHFSQALQGVAKYYRITVAPSDANGNPTGGPVQLSAGLSWLRDEYVAPNIVPTNVSLGPNAIGGEANLFEIPYEFAPGPGGAPLEWHADQFHGTIVTSDGSKYPSPGRYLVTLELFDAVGQKLRPNRPRPAGTIDPGTNANFVFKRWSAATVLDDVLWGGLTHMFWWDNGYAFAKIEDIRLNGVANSAECQFLVGTRQSLFSAGFRAYHPNPAFLLGYTIWWHRGLGTAVGPTPPISGVDNAGQPPALVAVTPGLTFDSMLGPNDRCSFALNLDVQVKTFDGYGQLQGLNRSDQAAFALEA